MIRPLNDRVLVEKIEEAEKPADSLIIRPDVARNPSQRGTVLAIGQGRAFDGPGEIVTSRDGKVVSIDTYRRQAMLVKPGDIVLWGAFSGTEVAIDGKTYFLLREDELIAVDDSPLEVAAKPEETAALAEAG